MDTLAHIKKKWGLRYLVDQPIQLPIDRLHGLYGLFKELGFTVGAEIGVQRGHNAKWMCCSNRKLKLYCIDPWQWYEDYVDYGENSNQELYDEFFAHAQERLKPFNVEFIRKFSMDAVDDFEDESLDFVYIDGNNQFEYVIEDVAKWERKVKKGGIVAGHDYRNSVDRKRKDEEGNRYTPKFSPYQRLKLIQVKTAMDAWCFANRIKPWFITTATSDDSSPSWFYVKQ